MQKKIKYDNELEKKAKVLSLFSRIKLLRHMYIEYFNIVCRKQNVVGCVR